MAKPGEVLAKQLYDEADRIAGLGYQFELPHELRRHAAAVSSAQIALDHSKQARQSKVTRHEAH